MFCDNITHFSFHSGHFFARITCTLYNKQILLNDWSYPFVLISSFPVSIFNQLKEMGNEGFKIQLDSTESNGNQSDKSITIFESIWYM